MKCDKCQNKAWCYDGNHELTRHGCAENNWCCFSPITNADRIRAMTDEELAHAFAYQCAGRVCRGIPYDGPNECENCWLEWLKQEADNGK